MTSDWADIKTESVPEIEGAGYSCITKMGVMLFHFAGSGNHDHIDDFALEEHFKKQMQTQLCSIWFQVTKSTLDAKCEKYQKITDDVETELCDWLKVIEFLFL